MGKQRPKKSTYRGITKRNFRLDSIHHGKSDSDGGITKQSKNKYASSLRKWQKFTTDCDTSVFLRTSSKQERIQLFSGFAYRLRNNYAGKTSQNELRGQTIRRELNTVSAAFQGNGHDDPIRDGNGNLAQLLSRQLNKYEGDDPPVKKEAPLSLEVFTRVARMRFSHADRATSELICGALFFAMRSCEYLKTPSSKDKKTTLLELRDLKFYDINDSIIPNASDDIVNRANKMTVTFRNQKNGEKDETITLCRNSQKLCGVETWSKLVHRVIRLPNANSSTSVNAYFNPSSQKVEYVTSKMVTKMLQHTVLFLGEANLGIKISEVGTHSIRSSFAMHMALNNAKDSVIQKKGRWKSLAFMEYIRNYVDTYGHVTSSFICNSKTKFKKLK